MDIFGGFRYFEKGAVQDKKARISPGNALAPRVQGVHKPADFGKSPFAPADFEVVITKYVLILRPIALFYRTDPQI